MIEARIASEGRSGNKFCARSEKTGYLPISLWLIKPKDGEFDRSSRLGYIFPIRGP